MTANPLHQCKCAKCNEPGSNPTKELHAQMNVFLSTLPDHVRGAFLGKESMNPAYGGDQQLELITGVSATTIAKLRWQQQIADLHKPYPSNGKIYTKTRTADTSVHPEGADNYFVAKKLGLDKNGGKPQK
jgi:hypothetical protein